MSNSELIKFFDEASSFTEFERRKKIYELTNNNLDIDLLYDLKNEYREYINSLKLNIKLKKDKDYEQNPALNSMDVYNIRIWKAYIETFLKDNKRIEGTDDIEDEGNIFGIIRDLINRKMSDLPKNSRHKNNLNFTIHHEESEAMDLYAFDVENIPSDELMDLSNDSIVGKIIYLEKLGVIDYFRTQKPFNTSVNSIATILSAITGAKATSIQPLLNPLLSKDVFNKNNPLNSKKKVSSVENILLNMGVDVKKNDEL